MNKLTVILAAAMLCALPAHAEKVKAGTKLLEYLCQPEKSSLKYSFVITAARDTEARENINIPAILTVVRVPKLGEEILVIPKEFQGTYHYEDVVNNFNSKDGKVNLVVYADELDQTVFTNGSVNTIFDCNPQ